MQYYISDTERRKELFYLTTHSTHFFYGYMESVWIEKTVWMFGFFIGKREITNLTGYKKQCRSNVERRKCFI